jgi:fatty acid-binding protein DegV
MEIKIVSDSTCSLPEELLEKYNVTVLPMRENQKNEAGMVSSKEFADCFHRFAPYYDAVIAITSGSRFSNSYHNAWLASRKYKNAYIVDSRSISCGQGLLILEAAKLASKGTFPEKICERLSYTATYIEESFVS